MASASITPKDMKTSQRVVATIAKFRMHDEPIHIEPDEIGADWTNRMGSTPNISIVHSVIATSLSKDGYDPSKPQIGLCRSFAGDPDRLEKLLKWNNSFTAGDARYPFIHKAKMTYGSLACTHLNLAGRMFKEGMTTIEGIKCGVDSKPLQDKQFGSIVRLCARIEHFCSLCCCHYLKYR